MSKFSDFYTAKSKYVAELSPQFPTKFVLAVSTTPGTHCPVEVSIDCMAELLANGTHRIATASEAEGFRAAHALARSRSVPVDGLEAARALYRAITTEGGQE